MIRGCCRSRSSGSAPGQHDRIVAENVAVIGGGETAASMLNELFHHRVSAITAISPQATLFTRGEGFFENSLFSDPTGWRSLSQAERRDCIARTDRGVFSARVQESLLADERISICAGGWRPGGQSRQPNLDHAVHR